MKNLRKKIALLLAFVMVLSLVPAMNMTVHGASGVTFYVEANAGGMNSVGYRAYLLDADTQTADFEMSVDPAWFSDLNLALEGVIPVPTDGQPPAPATAPATGMAWVVLGGQWTQVPLFQLELRLAGRRDLTPGAAARTWQYSQFIGAVTVTSGGSVFVGAPPAGVTNGREQDVTLHGLAIPNAAVGIAGTVQVRHHDTTVALYLRTVVDGAPVRTRIMDAQPLTREWTGLAAPGRDLGIVISRRGGDAHAVRNLNRFNPVIETVPDIRITEYRPGTLQAGDNLQVRLEAPAGFTWQVPTPAGAGQITIAPGGSFVGGFTVTEGTAVATGVTGTSGWVIETGATTSILSVIVPIGPGGLTRGGDTAANGFFDISGLRLVPRNPGFVHPHETNFSIGVGVTNVASTIVNSTVRDGYFASRVSIRGSRDVLVATFWQQGIQLAVSGAPTQVTAGRLDQEVVTFTVSEIAPQSFNPAATLPISVIIDHVGVRIVGFEYRVYNVGQTGDYRGDWNAVDVVGDGEQVMVIVETDANDSDVREIEFRLFLDIEPGFGINNWSRNIVAEVNVLGINSLPVGNRTVPVAVVRDPISLAAGAPVELDIHGDPFGVILPNVIPTITIREEYVGAIREGHLYVYLVPTVGVHPGIVFNDPFGNLGLRVPPTPIVTGDPSFSIRFAEVMQPGHGTNDTNFVKIRYIVDNVSQNSPATITFAGGSIEGVATTIPGLNVSFAVGGTSIIEGWDSAIAETVPYRVQVATFGEQLIIGTPPPTPPTPPPTPPTPPPTPTPPTRPPMAPIIVNPDADFRGVDNPVVVRPGRESMMAIRAFVYLLEANGRSEDLIETAIDGNTALITVRARNRDRVWMDLSLSMNLVTGEFDRFVIMQPTAGGQTQFIQLPTAPENIGGRVTLPIGIIADLFGYGLGEGLIGYYFY